MKPRNLMGTTPTLWSPNPIQPQKVEPEPTLTLNFSLKTPKFSKPEGTSPNLTNRPRPWLLLPDYITISHQLLIVLGDIKWFDISLKNIAITWRAKINSDMGWLMNFLILATSCSEFRSLRRLRPPVFVFMLALLLLLSLLLLLLLLLLIFWK